MANVLLMRVVFRNSNFKAAIVVVFCLAAGALGVMYMEGLRRETKPQQCIHLSPRCRQPWQCLRNGS
jgi:hypothetical protein